jgi:cyclopropane fatty-acyl-phospholipid synthase-like methyltransferase
MPDWFRTLSDDLWLPPDEVGEDEARFIRGALRLRRGQRVLDAPCGAGRIGVHLALAGCDVTGVE